MGEPKKKKRLRRGFVACPACGEEARMGLKVCPECNAKLPGAGGFPIGVVLIVVVGIAALAVAAFVLQGRAPEKKKAKKPREELIAPAEETAAAKPAVKKEKAEEGNVLDDIFGDAGLPEPTMEAPGAEKVKPEAKEGEDALKE